jgi:hypothetical protein
MKIISYAHAVTAVAGRRAIGPNTLEFAQAMDVEIDVVAVATRVARKTGYFYQRSEKGPTASLFFWRRLR